MAEEKFPFKPVTILKGGNAPAILKPKPVDWFHWKNMQSVKLWDAALLACNIDPHNKSNSGNKDKVGKLFSLIDNNINNKEFFTPLFNGQCQQVLLSELAAWCQHIGYPIPAELAALAPSKLTGQAKPKQSVTSNNQSVKTYDRQRDSFQEWLDDSRVNIGVLTVGEILKQIKLGCKPEDKSLWIIKESTFRRNFWQAYSKEYGIKKKGGRRAGK